MNRNSELLDQLRIDRSSGGEGWLTRRSRWVWGIGIVVILAVTSGIAILKLAQGSIPVHAVAAKASAASVSSPPSAESLLDASGYVIPLREATVSGKNIYKVSEVMVQEGQTVKEGEIMARLDDTNARAALEQSKAQVKQLEAALAATRIAAEDARPLFLRNQRQLAESLISQDAFDASKSSYDAAQTAVTVAEQNLSVARANVVVSQRYEDDTIIRAPFNGVVTVRTAQPGEIVSPQFLGGGGIAKIVDMDSLEVDVDVSEKYINRVHPKQPAVVTLNAYPDWQIPAEVIAVIPTADRAKATVKVRIGFKIKDPRIVPEMGAHVSFLEDALQASLPSSQTPAAVIVPQAAVLANGDKGTVFVIKGDHIERRSVRLGARTASGQTISVGLEPGVTLAQGELGKLRDGEKIQVLP